MAVRPEDILRSQLNDHWASPQVLEAAARQAEPRFAIRYYDAYEGQPYASAVLEAAAKKAATGDTWALWDNIPLLKDKPFFSQVLQTAIAHSPDDGVTLYSSYKDQPNADALLQESLSKCRPSVALDQYNIYKDKPFAAAALEKAVRAVAASKNDARFALYYYSNYKDQPYAAAVLKQAAHTAAEDAEDAGAVLENYKTYKDQPYAMAVVEAAARHCVALGYASGALRYFSLYKNQPWANEVRAQAAEKDPLSAVYFKVYPKGHPEGQDILGKGLLRIAAGERSGDIIEYYKYYKDEPYAKEVLEKAISTPQGALRLVREINYRHEDPDAVRFASVNGLSANSLYDLITQGRQELYTSSYNGLLDHYLTQLSKEGGQLAYGMGSPDRVEKLPIFLEAAAAYGKFDKVWEKVRPAERENVLNLVIDKAANPSSGFNYAVSLAEMTGGLAHLARNAPDAAARANNKAVLEQLENKILTRFNNSSGEAKDRLGLIASYYARNYPDTITDKNKAAFLGLSHNPTYQLPVSAQIESAKLFTNGKHYQLYVFYDDGKGGDGQSSFESFLQSHKGEHIEDKGSYICIRKAAADGKEMLLYANKPDQENGLRDINQEVAIEQHSPPGKKPTFNMVVHRGHSYHADHTIENIQPDAAFVFLGSCGGFHEVTSVLKRAPNAHILATKGTGTMAVNDPLLTMINARIANGQPLNWQAIWQEDISRIQDGRKEEYVRPDQNAAALLNKRYYELQDTRGVAAHQTRQPEVPHHHTLSGLVLTAVEQLSAPLIAPLPGSSRGRQ